MKLMKLTFRAFHLHKTFQSPAMSSQGHMCLFCLLPFKKMSGVRYLVSTGCNYCLLPLHLLLYDASYHVGWNWHATGIWQMGLEGSWVGGYIYFGNSEINACSSSYFQVLLIWGWKSGVRMRPGTLVVGPQAVGPEFIFWHESVFWLQH